MSYLARIEHCNRHDLAGFVPLIAGDATIGHLRCDRVDDLTAVEPAFRRERGRCRLEPCEFTSRTAAFARAATHFAERGLIRPLTGELYPVAAELRGVPLALVDRGAVAFFGIPSAGVHLNGFVRSDAGIEMWIAERAAGKATYPGMLDNMVAGGQPHEIGLMDNVAKECAEEAGVPEELARTALPVGAVSYVYEDDSGLKPDTMFCFDLELPRDFEPRAVDGEVARFLRLPIAEVASIVRDTSRFKFNCNLVVIDFLVRHGLLDIEHRDHPRILAGLRQHHGSTLPSGSHRTG